MNELCYSLSSFAILTNETSSVMRETGRDVRSDTPYDLFHQRMYIPSAQTIYAHVVHSSCETDSLEVEASLAMIFSRYPARVTESTKPLSVWNPKRG